MSEVDAALLDAIRLDPSHWDTWLVFADYLSEADDPRGQLIRYGHRLAMGAFVNDRERDELERALLELRRRHGPQWRDGLSPPQDVTLQWRHGFVVGVTSRGNAETTLRFLADLLSRPVALPLGSLVVQHPCSERDLDRLASLSGVERLVSLDLAWTGLGDAGVRALARGPWVQLRELSLAVNDVTAAGIRALARAALENLRGLDLHGNPIGPDGIGWLAEAGLRGPLDSLDVGDTQLGDVGARHLARAPTLRSTARLYLRRNGIGVRGVTELTRLPAVTRLNLASNPLGPEAGPVLAQASLDGLGSLSLLETQLGDAGVVALARTARWPALATLQLARNDLGDPAATALARSLLPLRSLSLWGNRITELGARELLDAPTLHALESLDLRDNEVAPDAIEALRDLPGRRGRTVRVEL